MLVELHIEGLGVIERVELVLDRGLIALTGETGAGKTMLVEAIELLVGGRADASMVRPGAAEARVDGRFVLPDRAGGEGPAGAGSGSGSGDDEVVLTRVVPADGRSRAYVNGRLSTVTSLAEIAAPLVDLHGQHAHQSLLAASTQRAALDTFAGVDLEPLRAARARVTELDAELAALGGDERSRAREIDLLRFQVDELDRAELTDPDEDARLEAEESLLADAVAHRDAGAAALGMLDTDEAGRDAVARAAAALAGRAPYEELDHRLQGVLAELDDIVGELRSVAEGIEEDPQRLDAVRARRQLLRDLCRKYGDDLTEVMNYHREIADRLRDLGGFEQRAAELDAERARAVAAEGEAARVIGERRREAAPALAALVETRLADLAMGGAAIRIEVGDHPDDHPGDKVRFLLAANPGSPLLPLTRVASGGELARAMLALRLALTVDAEDQARVDVGVDRRTLVFDEVDAGIGGTAAVAVGAALAALAEHHQVLVVTHLPQVAARADRQVVVSKHVVDHATVAEVNQVAGDDRVGELARMLSGDDGEASREHARALLDGSS
ncbi:MAG: DNA repair protein RecN [Ilumatobacteraceae bacterium]